MKNIIRRLGYGRLMSDLKTLINMNIDLCKPFPNDECLTENLKHLRQLRRKMVDEFNNRDLWD